MKDHKKAELREQKVKEERLLALENELSKKNEELTKIVEAIRPRQPSKKESKKSDLKHGYVYLLQEREFIDKKEDTYKIGMTRQANLSRFRSYPKGSKLLFQLICDDCVKAEKIILQKFKEMFTQIKSVGTEYFRGDYRKMIDVMYRVIKSESVVEEVEAEKSMTEAEKIILQKFKEMFTQIGSVGTEYFSGNYRKMIDVMNGVVKSESVVEEVEVEKIDEEKSMTNAEKYDAICRIIFEG
jgi:flagellar biosynthesis regulator FlbT